MSFQEVKSVEAYVIKGVSEYLFNSTLEATSYINRHNLEINNSIYKDAEWLKELFPILKKNEHKEKNIAELAAILWERGFFDENQSNKLFDRFGEDDKCPGFDLGYLSKFDIKKVLVPVDEFAYKSPPEILYSPFSLELCLNRNLYGKGQSKTWRNLLLEIHKGECEISFEQGMPIRKIKIVAIEVQSPDGKLTLVEHLQVFSDGRKRSRNILGLSEKLVSGESPIEAAVRALREELNISVENCRLSKALVLPEQLKESPSYPGLTTKYLTYQFRLQLRSEEFHPEGYIECQQDKKTYFVWS